MDEDGYPALEELKKIRKWDVTKDGTDGLITYIRELWRYGLAWCPYKSIGNRFKFELHTGGWSGNEDIIAVLQKNFFWFLFWEMSKRGGHYYFEGLKLKPKKGVERACPSEEA